MDHLIVQNARRCRKLRGKLRDSCGCAAPVIDEKLDFVGSALADA
jgi:hypothetical protein